MSAIRRRLSILTLGVSTAVAQAAEPGLVPRWLIDAGRQPAFPERLTKTTLPIPTWPSTTLPVTKCEDDGTLGTLRSVVAGAMSGDVVDLSQLNCGTITLLMGQIEIDVDYLSVIGPGASALTISGNHADRIFANYGGAPGRLSISNVTIADGFQPNALFGGGGCIFSSAASAESQLVLTHVTLTRCVVGNGTPGGAVGGGLMTYGSLTLRDSTLTGNVASGRNGATIRGGAGYSQYLLTIANSTIADNMAVRSTTGTSGSVLGGGLCVLLGGTAASSITGSTISGNHADDFGGGLFLAPSTFAEAVSSLTIANSTVSSNVAGAGAGIEISTGVDAQFAASIENSTIAFNAATGTGGCGGFQQAGSVASVADFESTIAANNTANGVEFDLCSHTAGNTLVGANNIIMVSQLPPPADTIAADPMLVSLDDNGGPTATHALMSASPAIDGGNDLGGFNFDQRGVGYARIVGTRSDVGAFEVQVLDLVFADGFEL